MDDCPSNLFGRVEIGCLLQRYCCVAERRCVGEPDALEALSLSVEGSSSEVRWPDWNSSDSEKTESVSAAEDILDQIKAFEEVAVSLDLAHASTYDISMDDTADAADIASSLCFRKLLTPVTLMRRSRSLDNIKSVQTKNSE